MGQQVNLSEGDEICREQAGETGYFKVVEVNGDPFPVTIRSMGIHRGDTISINSVDEFNSHYNQLEQPEGVKRFDDKLGFIHEDCNEYIVTHGGFLRAYGHIGGEITKSILTNNIVSKLTEILCIPSGVSAIVTVADVAKTIHEEDDLSLANEWFEHTYLLEVNEDGVLVDGERISYEEYEELVKGDDTFSGSEDLYEKDTDPIDGKECFDMRVLRCTHCGNSIIEVE